MNIESEQPISYSEEEVRELLKKVLTEEPEEPDQIPAKYFWEWFNIWFETNKKK